jgi:predicted nucleotidyltransferase
MTPATQWKRQQLAHFIRLKLEPESAVQGVLVVGSVAAGTAHEGSDIDAVVFLSPFDLYVTPAESIWRESDDSFHSIFEEDMDLQENGLQLDFKRLDWRIWRDPSHDWPEPMRAELGNAWVAFDRTGEVGRIVTERTRYESETRLARLDEAIIWLDQHLNYDSPEKRWRTLGPIIAHDRLHAAYEYLVQALFAYNESWRIWRNREMTALLQLPWLPKKLDSHLLTALSAPAHDHAGFSERAETLGQIFREILNRLIDESIYGDDPVSEAFIRSNEEPGRAWNMEDWNKKHQERQSI